MVAFFLAWMINWFHELCLLPLFNTEIFSTFQDLLAMHVTGSRNYPARSLKIPSCKLQESLKIPSKFPENLGRKFFGFWRNSARKCFEKKTFLRNVKVWTTCVSTDHFRKRFQNQYVVLKAVFKKQLAYLPSDFFLTQQLVVTFTLIVKNPKLWMLLTSTYYLHIFAAQ